MAPIDPTSLDSGTPRTLDGRTYPDHLRPYEALDPDLLPLVADGAEFEQEDLVAAAPRRFETVDIALWIGSATWRGLLERRDRSMSDPGLHAITQRGQDHLRHL